MRVKIIDSTGIEWYSDYIGDIFKVEAIPRGGFKHILVKCDGERYGYVNKKHCVPVYEIEFGKCKIGVSFTKENKRR